MASGTWKRDLTVERCYVAKTALALSGKGKGGVTRTTIAKGEMSAKDREKSSWDARGAPTLASGAEGGAGTMKAGEIIGGGVEAAPEVEAGRDGGSAMTKDGEG